VANSQSEWKDENEPYLRHSLDLLRRDSVQGMFTHYDYDEVKKASQIKKQQRNNMTQKSICYGAINIPYSC